MRRVVWALLLLTNVVNAQHEPFMGNWKGMLVFGEREMDIHISIFKSENGLEGTLSSEKQQLQDIRIRDILIDKDSVKFTVPLAGGRWEGRLMNGELNGNWIQGPYSATLNFARIEEVPQLEFRQRKQTPIPPYPYREEEVIVFNSADQVRLAGALTLPGGEGPFPAAILLSVAGPNDRDQSHGAPLHQPFRVIADFLSRRGIAVLRMDDRGVGGSGGNLFESSIEDFARDANAAFSYLESRQEIDRERIGFIGNSEGSLVGPLAASQNGRTGFIITLGGIGITGGEVILEQGAALARLAGIGEDKIEQSQNRTKELFSILTENTDSVTKAKRVKKMLEEWDISSTNASYMLPESLDEKVRLFTSTWYIYQINYDPGPILQRLTCPFLALHGSEDPFVASDKNLNAIANHLAIAGNNSYALIKLEDVNHVFQDAPDGSPLLYSTNESTFSLRALEIMYSWLQTIWQE